MKNEEFYIGWQSEAPAGVARWIRRFILCLLAVVLLAALLIVRHQRGFATATYELGKTTTLSGILVDRPVPFLEIYRGRDAAGKAVYQDIVLVGKGKHGARNTIAKAESAASQSLYGKAVRLEGSLIYHDGHTLLELSGPVTPIEMPDWPALPGEKSLGQTTIQGEIIDPKCYFGVMKPGEGKPHRSCAIRCISGGIPPVFKTISADGSTQYYLLVGAQGEPINDEVLPYVADQTSVSGEIKQLGDWLVLYKKGDITLATPAGQ